MISVDVENTEILLLIWTYKKRDSVPLYNKYFTENSIKDLLFLYQIFNNLFQERE